MSALAVVGAAAGGAVVTTLCWAGLRDTLHAPVFLRHNYRDRELPTGAGVVLVLAVLLLEAAVTVLDVLGVDVDAATILPRRLAVVTVLGFGLLGLLDDLAGVGESGGFKAHVRALFAGRLTTGGAKLLGGAALAVVVVAQGTSGRALGWLIADAALVALAANLGNLLDRAPGRVIKASGLVFLVLAVATGAGPELVGVAAIVGGACALLVPDLREQLMLGDAGANVIGAAVGLGAVLACSEEVRLVLLVLVVALNVASEMVSFSRVIDRVGPLRAFDRLGRRP
jgi:UDP-N-acetylmuramyl pentapeptide phosphotransferase/UDP-N-acetylglucosamine-1-phosphate transferase